MKSYMKLEEIMFKRKIQEHRNLLFNVLGMWL